MQTVLFGFAVLTSLSIADCERKHGHHKQMGLVHFGTMSVQSISEEAQAHHVRLQQEVRKKCHLKQQRVADGDADADGHEAPKRRNWVMFY